MEKQRNSVGRRKEAVTRIFISKGSGTITVNDKDFKTYFPLVYLQNQVVRPLKTVEAADKFDVKINAAGGGVKGQAEAAMLGIARVLIDLNPEFRPALKAAGLLKRDPRSVERKNSVRRKPVRASSFRRDSYEPQAASFKTLLVACRLKLAALNNHFNYSIIINGTKYFPSTTAPRSRCAFRSPEKEVEPKDVALHFR
jgi:small subunit ribosomal protein S9